MAWVPYPRQPAFLFMATLKSLLSSDILDVFLPTDSDGNAEEFNEQIEIFPKGQQAKKVTTQAIVQEDALEGSREARGDGITHNTSQGRSIRESIVVSIPQTAISNIRIRPSKSDPDLIKIADGSVYAVKRILGRDAGMFDVLAVHRKDLLVARQTNSG
tara:strand:- start:17024 stop:17500 length:477 start_codon:yes stop_codon:yes gene_type:complete